MSSSPPDGYHSVTPALTVHDAAAALDFYVRAFGAEEQFRLPMPDGKIGHAEIRIGDSVVMLSDEFPDWGCVSPQSRGGATGALMLYVEDVDAAYQRALEAGAQSFMPVENQFWGDRMGSVVDPFGHRWNLATQIEQLSPAELERRMKAFAEGRDPTAAED